MTASTAGVTPYYTESLGGIFYIKYILFQVTHTFTVFSVYSNGIGLYNVLNLPQWDWAIRPNFILKHSLDLDLLIENVDFCRQKLHKAF